MKLLFKFLDVKMAVLSVKCMPSETKPENMDWYTPLGFLRDISILPSLTAIVSHQCRAFVLHFQPSNSLVRALTVAFTELPDIQQKL